MNHFGQSLRYFIKTVELGSLTLAAEHFEISQSAISQQLSALEKELGSRLFIRKDKKGLTLSKNGELLYEKGKRILEDFDTLILEIKEKRNEKIETPIHYSILVSEGGDLLVPSLQ
ncbi:MAG: LysR family transcriptional regulator, partial [Bacilli bacterium]|nr:LysR family transcriptional regulator [Bacilli bacterium]